MHYDKPDQIASLAGNPAAFTSDSPGEPVKESLGRAGAGFVSRGKVKTQAITSPCTNLYQLTGSVQGSFGIVYHPTLELVRRGSDILILSHQCGCRAGSHGSFCAHCAALLVHHYGHADARILPAASADLSEEDHPAGVRIRLGTRMKSEEPVYWMPEDARRVATANLAVVGGEDTGNTQLVQSIAIQLLRQKAQLGEPIGLLLFDGLDDYSDSRANFLEVSGARTLRLHKLPFNPFSLSGLERRPQLHTHVAMAFADSLVRAYSLGALEKSTLVQSILSAYAAKGITSDPLTWNLQPPAFEDLYEEYCARPQGQRSEALDRVLDNLSLLELFDSDASALPPLFDQLRGTLVFDMSGYPEPLKHFVLGVVLEVLHGQMCGRERTLGRSLQKMILIDNADRLLSSGSSGLKGLLTQGREFGVGLLLSAHSMNVFRDEALDYRKWIRVWAMHSVEDLRKSDLEFLLQMDIHDSALERLYQESRHMGKLHSLVRIGSEEPLLSEDLPFYEIAGDAGQSYLIPERSAPEPAPLAGMPLLDTENLDALVTLEDEVVGPMGLFDGL